MREEAELFVELNNVVLLQYFPEERLRRIVNLWGSLGVN